MNSIIGNEAIFTAILSLIGTLCGSLGGILATSKLTTYRITQLEKGMEELKDLIRRVYRLEQQTAIQESRIKTAQAHYRQTLAT